MKSILMPAALAIALTVGVTSAPVRAAGCLKGAAIGGVAGYLRVTTVCWGLVQAVSLGATRQTSMRVNAPNRTGHLATAASPATPARLPPFASAKAPPVVRKECHAARGTLVRAKAPAID